MSTLAFSANCEKKMNDLNNCRFICVIWLITAHNSSCGKVIFSQVSVNLFGGGGRVSLVPGPFLVPGSVSFPGGRVSLVPCSFWEAMVSLVPCPFGCVLNASDSVCI